MELDTPCIGVCSTVYGDNICRGCKRFYPEIIAWNAYGDDQKDTVFSRLNQLISEVTQDKLTIIDSHLLRETLQNFNIRFRDDQSPLCWAYYLLRDARHKITSTEEAGFSVADAYKNLKLAQLYQLLDEALFARAEAAFNHSLDVKNKGAKDNG